MPDPNLPESSATTDSSESFDSILSEFERNHKTKAEQGSREGTVISISADSVILDIGFKTEGILPLTELQNDTVKPGDRIQVTIKGRDPEGYYQLSRHKAARPRDWAALERAFAEKTTILGTVTGVVKGGLSVDVGVRAFMPASRSGMRDGAALEKLIDQEIQCRIIKLEASDEDIVVDRRVVMEEEDQTAKRRRYSELREGNIVIGTVRNLTDYGAFVDMGGADALLHIGDISWSRIGKPADLLTVDQQVEVKVLAVDPEKQRISVGIKQMQPHPWDSVPDKYKVGDRVRGTVTQLTDFGAFVEVEPGVEGLIHISEMSWVKKVKKPSDLLKSGETVEAVILGLNLGDRRMSLGLKQALGNPWTDAAQRFPVGSVAEGTVVSLTKFGAFVQIGEGIEGMIHVSDMSAEKRINHPQDVLKLGQSVRAQVLELDVEKRRLKLGMKQLLPTSIDEYLSEHKQGDVVSGRVLEVSGDFAMIELGEGIKASCRVSPTKREKQSATTNQSTGARADLASLSSMLQARWKGVAGMQAEQQEQIHTGQIRRFSITRLDQSEKKIELEIL